MDAFWSLVGYNQDPIADIHKNFDGYSQEFHILSSSPSSERIQRLQTLKDRMIQYFSALPWGSSYLTDQVQAQKITEKYGALERLMYEKITELERAQSAPLLRSDRVSVYPQQPQATTYMGPAYPQQQQFYPQQQPTCTRSTHSPATYTDQSTYYLQQPQATTYTAPTYPQQQQFYPQQQPMHTAPVYPQQPVQGYFQGAPVQGEVGPGPETYFEEADHLPQAFVDQINRMKGSGNLRDNQYNLLLEIAVASLQYKDPIRTFNALVDALTGTPREQAVWGSEKARIIKKELSQHLPDKKQIVQMKISEIAKTGVVCFYKKGVTAMFGNFAICPEGIDVFGKIFVCAEAAFQYRKYELLGASEDELRPFLKANGEKAFELSRELGKRYQTFNRATQKNEPSLPEGWLQRPGKESIRDKTMRKILIAKFEQNSEMMKALGRTGDAYLLEHNESEGRDRHWSDNHIGDGDNELGKMLMRIRNPDEDLDGSIGVKSYSDRANAGLPYQIW